MGSMELNSARKSIPFLYKHDIIHPFFYTIKIMPKSFTFQLYTHTYMCI